MLKKKSETVKEFKENKTLEQKQAELKAELDKKAVEDSNQYLKEYRELCAKWKRKMGSQYVHTQGYNPEFKEIVIILDK